MKKLSISLMLVVCTMLAMAQKNNVRIERVGDTIVKTVTIYVHDTVFANQVAQSAAPVAACNQEKMVAQPVPAAKIVGAIQAPFSVGESKHVYFSKGNLQYQPATHTWRFAELQYDFSGTANSQISEMTPAWIDLFAWGTANHPVMVSTDDALYPKFEDWGKNAISNGGDKEDMWRTLSKPEWEYLLEKRANASKLYALVRVNSTLGLILFPDNFVMPQGIKLSQGYAVNVEKYEMKINELTLAQFKKLEAAGAVLLPNAGYRKGSEFFDATTSSTRYWTSSSDGSAYGATLYFGIKAIRTNSKTARSYGQPVRLVCDAPVAANAFSVK